MTAVALKETIIDVIQQAGALALEWFEKLGDLKVEQKGDHHDIVTEADQAVEAFIRTELTQRYPDFGFLGEESGETVGKDGRWIVDPIDGTSSFLRGQYFWSISIALEEHEQITMAAVFAPVFKDLYFAELGKGAFRNNSPIQVSNIAILEQAAVCTGFACLRAGLKDNNLPRFCRIAEKTHEIRRYGSCALDICMLSEGKLEAFWEQNLGLYDLAAAYRIALEAGARVTDFSGKEGLYPGQILVTNGKVHEELLPLMYTRRQ